MRPIRFVVALLCLLALFVSAGCGIKTDSKPTELADSIVPNSLAPGALPTVAAEVALDGEGQAVFMVGPDNRRLIEVRRAVEPDPAAVLDELVLGLSRNERNLGISTALTRSTEVIDLDFDPLFQVVGVTLAENSLNPDSREQLLSFGQFVFTLTALDGVESVVFESESADGTRQTMPVQTDQGLTERGREVRRADFASIDPGFNIIAFPDDDVQAAPTPTELPAGGPTLLTVPIWVLDADDRLIKVSREVERTSSALLQTLFDGPLTEQEAGLRTAIPVDALSRGIDLLETDGADGETLGLAVVDLIADSLPPVDAGDERVLALAQIVFTLTELVEIDQVLVTIDGELTPMPTQFGIAEPFDSDDRAGLTRGDYAAFAPDILVLDRNYSVAPTATPESTDIPPDPAATEPTPTPTPGG